MMRELAGYPLNRAASYFSCGMIALLTRVFNEKISLIFSFLPPRTTLVLELNEMWKPYIANKKNKLWIWKALDRNTRHLIDWQFRTSIGQTHQNTRFSQTPQSESFPGCVYFSAHRLCRFQRLESIGCLCDTTGVSQSLDG